MTIKKTIISFLALPIILCNLNFTFADYVIINENRKAEKLSPGITHEKIERFTSVGSLNINVFRIKYTDENTSLKLLKSENSISERKPLSSLADSEDIVGAINGDFFNYNNHSTIGPMVDDGVLISSPLNDPTFYSFIKTKKDYLFFNNWDKTFFRIKNKNFTLPIDYINKPYYEGDKIILFDKFWSSKTLGDSRPENSLEMLVVDGSVKKFIYAEKKESIPDNGYVILATGSKVSLLKSKFKVNDKIEFLTDENFKEIDFSIGAGSLVLKNSNVLNSFSLNLNGRNPRTIIGYNMKSKEIILATVDGRTNGFVGLMKELGATDAAILDGGGSTEIIKYNFQTTSNEIINFPSDGSERRIHNGIGVENTYSKGTLKALEIIPEKEYNFIKTGLKVSVYGVDSNYNKTLIPPNKINWTISGGKGSFVNGTYFPYTWGNHKVKAEYKGISASKSLNILENIVALKVVPDKLELASSEVKKIEVFGVSEDGYTSKLTPESISFSIDRNLASLKHNGTVTASENSGFGMLKVSFEGLTSFVPTSIGTKKELIYDFEDNFCSFIGYPSEVKGKYSLSTLSYNNTSSGKLDYDFRHSDATRAAYIKFGEKGLILDKVPDKLGLNVYGDFGNGHWLRGSLTDASGNSFNVDFEKNVDWMGWKYVEAKLPENYEAPLVLNRIYVVEINPVIKDIGTILVDDLSAIYKEKYNGIIKENITRIKDISDFKIEEFSENNINIIGKSPEENSLEYDFILSRDSKNKGTYSIKDFGSSSIIQIDNSNRSIRTNNFWQWTHFIDDLSQRKNNDILILLTSYPKFNDKNEKELFYEKLENFSSKGHKAYVVFPDSKSSYEVVRGTSLIGIRTTDEILDSLIFNEDNGSLMFQLNLSSSETSAE